MQHRSHSVQPSTKARHRLQAAAWRNYQRFFRPWDNDEPPRQVAQRRARTHTLHARTCRRPSVSCAVNYVHKFHIKNSPSREWLLAQLGAATASRQWENRAESDGEHRLDPNADSEFSVSVSHTNRRARRLRCGYSTTPKATNGENLSEGWNFERKPSFFFFFFKNRLKKHLFFSRCIFCEAPCTSRVMFVQN